MAGIKSLYRLAIGTLAMASVCAFAQTAPKDVLKAITDARIAKYEEARAAGKTINFVEVNDLVKAKAVEAIKDVDPSKVDAKDAYDWAQIFSLAGRNKDVCDLTHKFLSTNPAADQKFSAQMLMMSSCNALGEGEMLAMTLREIQPPNAMNGRTLASMTTNQYIDTVAKTQGVDEALKVLAAVEAKIPQEDHKAYAERTLAAMKQREAQTPPKVAPAPDADRLAQYEAASKSMAESIKFQFVDKKAELLIQAGKKPEAIKVLNEYAKNADPKSPSGRNAIATVKRMTMIGEAAPVLNVERSHGDFKGLEQYKGKVVIIDFFAHWCGPCKASYPDMRKLYDQLHGKGLEIVGVTTYYGYYNTEKNLDKDTEFSRMQDFIKEFNIAWPVAYGERTNFEAYGVTGIPHVTVLDRAGKVHSIEIGYSPALFVKFKEEIEKLVAAKG